MNRRSTTFARVAPKRWTQADNQLGDETPVGKSKSEINAECRQLGKKSPISCPMTPQALQ